MKNLRNKYHPEYRYRNTWILSSDYCFSGFERGFLVFVQNPKQGEEIQDQFRSAAAAKRAIQEHPERY